ncbi:MAG: O-methyltransferase [Gemmatimonadales bacterium]|nr:MAG: O-methyltransferase [Gemmatimonadales bacterium]
MGPAEAFVAGLFASEDAHLLRLRATMEAEGLPAIQLPATTARALQLLLSLAGCRRVLEIGTLAGYSALWIARALPDGGQVVSIDRDPSRTGLARRLTASTEVSDRLEFRTGEAMDILEAEREKGAHWDAVFLDADKEDLPRYVAIARDLLLAGGLLLVDNALWKGQVADPGVEDQATEAIREMLRQVASDSGFDATILTVGDGLLVARRR